MVNAIKKIEENNDKNFTSITQKVVETIKYYFKLDIDDEKWEKIFKIICDSVAKTSEFAKKNHLSQKTQDLYKTFLRTITFFLEAISSNFKNSTNEE